MPYDKIFNYPYFSIGIVFVLSVLDYYLTIWNSSLYRKGYAQFVEYENLKREDTEEIVKPKLFDLRFFFLKVLLVLALVLIWIQANLSISLVVKNLYFFLLGFTFFNFLIVDLRHLQNSLLFHYAKNHPEGLSGKIFYSGSFSLKQSAFQLFSFLILIFVFYLLFPSYLLLGGVLALVFLLLRNYGMAKTRAKTTKI
jgi:hypothetical protein